MQNTKINYEATRELGTKIQTEANNYQNIYAQQLYGTFKTALQNCFQGDDATSAMEQLDGLRDDFEAMKEVITQYGKQLVKSADNYEADMLALKASSVNLTANRK